MMQDAVTKRLPVQFLVVLAIRGNPSESVYLCRALCNSEAPQVQLAYMQQ